MSLNGGLLAIACEKIHNLAVPAFIKDGNLRFVAVNAAFEAFCGRQSADLLGKSLSCLTTRPEDEAFEKVEQRALSLASEQLALLFNLDGHRYCRMVIERFATEDGSVFVFGVSREQFMTAQGVTKVSRQPHVARKPGVAGKPGVARKPRVASAMQEKLMRSVEAQAVFRAAGEIHAGKTMMPEQSMMKAIVDALPVGVVYLDDDRVIRYFNSRMEDVLSDVDVKIEIDLPFYDFIARVAQAHGYRGENLHAVYAKRLESMERGGGKPDYIYGSSGRSFCVEFFPIGERSGLFVYTDVTAEQAFGRESALYRVALEHVPEAIFLRDSQRRLIFGNEAYAKLLGDDLRRFYGMTETDMFPEVADQLRAENLAVLEEGAMLEIEQLIEMPNGEEIALLTSLKRLEPMPGEHYLIGTLIDISALKLRERQLVEARERAERLYQDIDGLLGSMPVGVLVLDRDLRVVYANERAGVMIGWPAERDLLAASFEDFVRAAHEQGWPRPVGVSVDEYLETRKRGLLNITGSRRSEVKLADGTHILLTETRLGDDRILLTYTDFTAQRKNEREIGEARSRLHALGLLVEEATRVMTQGLCVVEHGQIVFANDVLGNIFETPSAETLIGQNWEEVFAKLVDRGLLGENAYKIQQDCQEELLKSGHYSIVLPAPNQGWLKWEARPSGENRFLLVVTDVSDAKARESELTHLVERAEAADRAKSRFLANMSHEIRTPMNGVLGMAELLAASNLDARQKTFVDVMVKSGRSLMTIINDILDFSEMDERALSLTRAPFDPVQAVEDVIALLSGSAQNKDIELILQVGSMSDMVLGDGGRFRQMMTNLINESISHTERGHVLIALSSRPVQPEMGSLVSDDTQIELTIRVEDTSTGFDADALKTLFSRFSQLEGSMNRHAGGSGLGLAIAAGLVDLFGGVISVEKAVHGGAVFTIKLPFALGGDRVDGQIGWQVKGARVLCLDDNPVQCAILTESFKSWGLDGLALSERDLARVLLDEALRMGQPIDVLVLDLAAKPEFWRPILNHIASTPGLSDLPVIALVEQNTTSSPVNAQCTVVLTKPLRHGVLKNAIGEVMRDLRLKRRSGQSANAAMLAEKQPAYSIAVAAPEMKPVMQSPFASVPPLPKPATPEQFQQKWDPILNEELRKNEKLERNFVQGPERGAVDVLVVEQKSEDRSFFRHILHESAFSFDVVGDIHQAFQIWSSLQPALVLVDLTLDGDAGFQLARTIRRAERADLIRLPTAIIGITSNLAHDRRTCLVAGMDDMMVKPISPEKLLERLTQWAGYTPDPFMHAH